MTKQQMVDRAALVTAIKRHAAEDRELKRKREVLSNARVLLDAAEAKLEAARSECEAAKAEHKTLVMDAAATSSALKASPRLRDARLQEAEARDEMEAARDAVSEMEAALVFNTRFDGSSNDPASESARDVAVEADEVIRREIDITSMLDECDRLFDELADKREAAVFLISKGLVPPHRVKEWGRRVGRQNLPAVVLLGPVDNPHIDHTIFDVHPSPTKQKWQQARAALRLDATTTLPTGPAPATVVPMRKAG